MTETETPRNGVENGIASISKRVAKRALDMGENRLQLLLLEVEEERERLFQAMVLALGVTVFTLLAGVAFTVVVLLVFWTNHALLAISVLTVFYAVMALVCSARLADLRKNWEAFSGTLSQLRKDCACLTDMFH